MIIKKGKIKLQTVWIANHKHAKEWPGDLIASENTNIDSIETVAILKTRTKLKNISIDRKKIWTNIPKKVDFLYEQVVTTIDDRWLQKHTKCVDKHKIKIVVFDWMKLIISKKIIIIK